MIAGMPLLTVELAGPVVRMAFANVLHGWCGR